MSRRFPIRHATGSSWVRASWSGARALPPLPAELVSNAQRVLREPLPPTAGPLARSLQVLRGGLMPPRRPGGAA